MAKAEAVLRELKRCGVTDVVGLPDNSSAALFTLLSADEAVQIHTVTREGEAFALASGLWMGGRTPVVLIQNTGLLESGDSFRGTAARMRVPLLCLITYRGYAKMIRLGDNLPELNPETLSRPDLDSTALVTEPTLKGWGLTYDFLRENEDVSRITDAFKRATELSFPVALLVTRDMT